MTKFCSVALIIALVAIVTAPATFLVDGAKAKNAAGINKADTAACISQGNDACGEGRCCMFYWGYGCEQTSDGITTDRYPWMKCLDPANTGNETAVPMDAEPLALTDEQIDMANAVLNGECMFVHAGVSEVTGSCLCMASALK